MRSMTETLLSDPVLIDARLLCEGDWFLGYPTTVGLGFDPEQGSDRAGFEITSVDYTGRGVVRVGGSPDGVLHEIHLGCFAKGGTVEECDRDGCLVPRFVPEVEVWNAMVWARVQTVATNG